MVIPKKTYFPRFKSGVQGRDFFEVMVGGGGVGSNWQYL